MSKEIKIKAAAGRKVRFPAECIHCNKPAPERLRVHKRIGRSTRLVDVPLCAECAHEVNRLSGEEERWYRLSWLIAGVAGLLVFMLMLVLLSPLLGFPLRLLLALSATSAAGMIMFRLSRRYALRHARPEKKAILNAAKVIDFSWRATTFSFSNETFAQRFSAINEQLLLD